MKKQNIFKKIMILFVSMLFIISSLRFSIKADEFDLNQYPELSEEELEILEELYKIDPNFTYEGELVSVAKSAKTMKDSLTRGSVESNDMIIIVTVARVNDESNKDTFDITATASWKRTPTIRMEDAFALSWSDNFALISDSCIASYKSKGIVSDQTERVLVAPNAEVGYGVECSYYYVQALDWARINARISKINDSGIANIVAAYCHETINVGRIGISSKNGDTISFDSGLGMLDERSVNLSFNY